MLDRFALVIIIFLSLLIMWLIHRIGDPATSIIHYRDNWRFLLSEFLILLTTGFLLKMWMLIAVDIILTIVVVHYRIMVSRVTKIVQK